MGELLLPPAVSPCRCNDIAAPQEPNTDFSHTRPKEGCQEQGMCWLQPGFNLWREYKESVTVGQSSAWRCCWTMVARPAHCAWRCPEMGGTAVVLASFFMSGPQIGWHLFSFGDLRPTMEGYPLFCDGILILSRPLATVTVKAVLLFSK